MTSTNTLHNHFTYTQQVFNFIHLGKKRKREWEEGGWDESYFSAARVLDSECLELPQILAAQLTERMLTVEADSDPLIHGDLILRRQVFPLFTKAGKQLALLDDLSVDFEEVSFEDNVHFIMNSSR